MEITGPLPATAAHPWCIGVNDHDGSVGAVAASGWATGRLWRRDGEVDGGHAVEGGHRNSVRAADRDVGQTFAAGGLPIATSGKVGSVAGDSQPLACLGDRKELGFGVCHGRLLSVVDSHLQKAPINPRTRRNVSRGKARAEMVQSPVQWAGLRREMHHRTLTVIRPRLAVSAARYGRRMESNDNESDLLDQIRARLPGGPDPDLELMRACVKDHPFLSVIGLLLGGDSTRRLVESIARHDQQVQVVAHALHALPGLGWAISSQVPIDAYREILQPHANAAADDLDAALDAAWNESSILSALPSRIGVLGAGDDDLVATAAERARLVRMAWEHHLNGAYEASVPIVLAQVDGITHDATTCAAAPDGRSFFSMNPARQADVADDETLAGIAHGLPAVRRWFSEKCISSGARGTANRHGVMHGRELRYDSRVNSTKSFVLLLAIWEWASHQLAGEAQRRKEARYAEHEGSQEVDDSGCRLDRRGFSATRERLRRLALAQRSFRNDQGRFGSLPTLRVNPVTGSLAPGGDSIEFHLDQDSWWAYERSEAGWIFAIGGAHDTTYYFDSGAPPQSGPPDDSWRSTDDGNWSGDCYW
jgi:hypothetical protein